MHCMAPASFTRAHISTGLPNCPRLLAQENHHSEKLSGSRFSHQFNSLAAKELESVFRPFAPFRSAALGERPAICSNGIMIQPLLKTEGQTAACAAVAETQRRGNRDEKQPTTPLPLDSGTLDDVYNGN